MKKLMFLALVLISGLSVFAQDGSTNTGGFRRGGGGNPRIREAIKQRLVSELNITPVQADSATAIQMAFQKEARALRQDTNITDADRKNKMKDLVKGRNDKLKGILTEDQIEKMEQMIEQMRNRREGQPGTKPD